MLTTVSDDTKSPAGSVGSVSKSSSRSALASEFNTARQQMTRLAELVSRQPAVTPLDKR